MCLYSFSKLSQNACLINTQIMVYQHVRCDCKLWNAPLCYWVFSYIIDEHACLKCCIFTKLQQIVCLIDVHILICQHAKYSYRLWKVLLFDSVFREFFIYITTCFNQTFKNCLLRQNVYWWKVNLLKYSGYVSEVFLFFSRLFIWEVHCPMSENNITKMNDICVW